MNPQDSADIADGKRAATKKEIAARYLEVAGIHAKLKQEKLRAPKGIPFAKGLEYAECEIILEEVRDIFLIYVAMDMVGASDEDIAKVLNPPKEAP